MTTAETKAALLAELESLGSTADEVAETLRAKGVKGKHGCTTCPVAIWLRKQAFVSPIVGSVNVVVGEDRQIELGIPYPVRQFIVRFDSERFPDLIEVSP